MEILALDTTSPEVTVALGRDGKVVAVRALPQKTTSSRLLPAVEEVLGEAQASLSALDGLLALRGPGSFTGTRIGLAIVLGLHRATGVRATAASTLEVLAAAGGHRGSPVLAAVHARHDDWYLQSFQISEPASWPRARDEPRRASSAELMRLDFRVCVRLGPPTLDERLAAAGREVLSPPPLAGVAAVLASRRAPRWNPTLLTRPLYLAPPPTTRAAGPKRVRPEG